MRSDDKDDGDDADVIDKIMIPRFGGERDGLEMQ
jgi:hypothetical protein